LEKNIQEEYGAPYSSRRRESRDNLVKQGQLLSKPLERILLFHLPFALSTLEGFVANEQDGDSLATTKPVNGNAFDVLISTEPYAEKVNGSTMIVPLRFAHRNHVSITRLEVTGTAMFGGDSLGKLSHTVVIARIDARNIPDDFKWDNGLYCDLATDAVNRFVEHYKIESGLPMRYVAHITRVTASMIMRFEILTIFDKRENYIEEYSDINGFMIGVLNEQVYHKLNSLLSTNAEPPIIESYYLQIENSLMVKNWRAAAIDCAVLFEAWLTPALKAIYKSQKLKSADIKNKFKTGEKHEPMPLGQIIAEVIQDATGFTFQETPECEELLVHSITLRNHIVHGRKFAVSGNEAQRSYAAIKAAIALIKQHMPS
jgi:hypothetical protein